MTNSEKLHFKQRLKQVGLAVIEQRMAAAQRSMDEGQEAANQEEKSSAGDKYETARAMGHLQKDMHARQLAEQTREYAALQTVNVNTLATTANAGTYIRCDQAAFFIAAGLGKQVVDDQTIFFLSPQAPLALSLQHKKTGDHFVFNNARTIIVELF